MVEINRLIENNEALKQYEFLFLPLISKSITVLTKLMKDYIQGTLNIANRLYLYIYSTTKRMQKYYKKEHR